MSKICINCGHKLKDNAKFCGKCGTKVEEAVQNIIEELKCINCGLELEADMKFCPKCGQKSEATSYMGDSVTDAIEKNKLEANKGLSNEELKRTVIQYTHTAKDKTESLVGDIKNYKLLPKNKKRNIVLALSGIIFIIVMMASMLFNFGASDKVVSQAALELAEQDYGYKLDIVSYNITDSFTGKSKIPLTGKKIKAKIYLVILEAEAKDTDGNTVDAITYAVAVVDPKKSGEYITYSAYSSALDCTGMEKKEIEKTVGSFAAAYR